jgi:hypothetical protein
MPQAFTRCGSTVAEPIAVLDTRSFDLKTLAVGGDAPLTVSVAIPEYEVAVPPP